MLMFVTRLALRKPGVGEGQPRLALRFRLNLHRKECLDVSALPTQSVCRCACYPTAMMALYDRIGSEYADRRRPDPRIAKAIWGALGDAESVVNVGAGGGSYEPGDRYVVAVEPSLTMIAQRPEGRAAAVQATASALPFEDDSFDAAMAILTVHHWRDQAKGLHEPHVRKMAAEVRSASQENGTRPRLPPDRSVMTRGRVHRRLGSGSRDGLRRGSRGWQASDRGALRGPSQSCFPGGCES